MCWNINVCNRKIGFDFRSQILIIVSSPTTYFLSDFSLRVLQITFCNHFLARSQYCENRLLASSCLSVCMEQFSSYWTDFKEILYLSMFPKSVEKIQVSLKSDKDKGYFTWRQINFFLIVSRSLLLKMKNISEKSCRENQNIHFLFNNFFSPKILLFMR